MPFGRHNKPEELESKALDAIKKYNLFSVKDIAAHMGISKQTFYNHKLDELDTLKEAVEINRLKTVQSLKRKWNNSNNATLQVALMKLVGDDETRKHLTQQNIDHTTKGEQLPQPQVYLPTDLTAGEIDLPDMPGPIAPPPGSI